MKKNIKRTNTTVAFQGEHGAYSEIAAHYLFGNKVKTIPSRYIDDVALAVETRKATHGIIMIENSNSGTLHYAFDLIEKHEFTITGEIYINIHHKLLGIKNSSKGIKRLKELKKVYSHPEALEECGKFFKKYSWIEPISSYDTAGSAKEVARRKTKEEGAVANKLAAKLYKLEDIADNIQNSRNNYVRFVSVKKLNKKEKKRLKGNKVSLVITLSHEPGSLSRFLIQCAGRGMNLTKVESRPMLDKTDEYYFYIDFEHKFEPEVLKRMLSALKEETTSFTLLGAYFGSNVHRRIDA